MSISTMVAETDSSFNRRRVRGPTQIYRPPPARSARTPEASPKSYDNGPVYKGELIQQQQQYLEALKEYQNNIHHNNANNKYSSHSYASPSHENRESDNKYKSRRPDQQFYVPRRRRPDDSTPCGTPTPYDDHSRAPSPAYSISSVVSEFSGRDRYNKHGRNRLSFQEEERVYNKPPLSSLSRESTPVFEKAKSKPPSLFASETLQLIERCINHDTHKPFNGSPSWENSPSNRHSRGRNNQSNDYVKSPNSPRDNHPVHSKENFIHPVDPNTRSRKGKRNRKRGSKSRDQSLENRDGYNHRGSFSTENLDRTYYNSNSSPFEKHNFNYDRMNSRNSSRASSRNPSVERGGESPSGYEWRVKGYSNPNSPTKSSPPALDKVQRRHSLGKPPSGKGIPYNVHMDTNNTPVSPTRHSPQLEQVNNSELQVRVNNNNNGSSEPQSQSLPSIEPVVTQLEEETKKLNEMTLKLNEFPLNSSHNEETYFSANESLDCTDNNADTSCDTSRLESPIDQQDSSLSESLSNQDGEGDTLLTLSFQSCSDTSCTNSSPGTPTKEEEQINSLSHTQDSIPHTPNSQHSEPEEITSSLKEVENISVITNTAEPTPTTEPSAPSSPSEAPANTEDSNPKKFSFNWADEMDQVKEEDSWDSLYDDSGNCLHSSVKKQLEDTIGKIKLQKPTNDYYEFKPQEHQIADDEYGHIIEIYDFPSTFQTQDLMMVFQEFKGFDLKWVDDTHALGIFSTVLSAADCLSTVHPFVKTRPLSKAIESSKSKAVRVAERLPFKARPQTSVALARRLVSGALGLKVQVSREQREAERQKLKDAKAKRRLIAKQKEDAWEGTISNNI